MAMHDHCCEVEGCAGSSLRQYIDLCSAYALNCRSDRRVGDVIRAWEERATREHWPLTTPEGEEDPELLVHIPFTHDVSVTGIVLATDADGTSPRVMRAFANRATPDLDTASSVSPTQEWDFPNGDPGATVEQKTRRSRFSRVSSLTLHFPDSFNSASTKMCAVLVERPLLPLIQEGGFPLPADGS